MRCNLCELSQTCKSIKIEPDGRGEIVFLGEAPGYEEDQLNTPFVGDSGKLLRFLSSKIDIPKENFRFTNSVRCRPPGNQTPTLQQLRKCSVHLLDEFTENPPNIIVPLGNTAIKALKEIGLLDVEGTISNLQARPIPYDGYIVFPMYHPSYVLRNQNMMEEYIKGFNELENIFKNGLPDSITLDYQFAGEIQELLQFFEFLKSNKINIVSYDIETSCLHPKEKDAEILCFSIGWGVGKSFGFVLTKENKDEALGILHDQLLENDEIKKVIQHLKFELLWSMSLGRTIKNVADTMLLHWHVDEKNSTHGLGKLALRYTDMGQYDLELEKYKLDHKECIPDKEYKDKETGQVRKGSYRNIPYEVLLPYNCADTDATLRVYNILLPQVTDKQLWIHNNIQIPSAYPLADMELNGVLLDMNHLNYLNEELPKNIKKIEDELFTFKEVKAVDEEYKSLEQKPLNFNSTYHLKKLLFDQLKLPSVGFTKKGKPSTDKDVLSILANRHPVPELILKRRSISTLHSTFVLGPIEQNIEGRIHTSYGMAHTETGRFNSRSPNLQNIPRDNSIKKMFVAEPDSYLLQIDYSQIELRVMAIFSGDKNLLQYFKDGEDIHKMIAAKIHKKDALEVSKEERTAAKRIVFGLCYGQGARGLSEELGIDEMEAQDFLNKFFAEFPAVKRWINKTRDTAETKGQVETLFGRIRRLPDAQLQDHMLKSRAIRQAINMPIQGTAADILAYKLSELWKFLKEKSLNTKMVLTVHDSIVLNVPEDEVDYVICASKLIMEDFDFKWIKIPITCEMEIGKSWGELKPIDNDQLQKIIQGKNFKEVLFNPT